VAVKVSIVMF